MQGASDLTRDPSLAHLAYQVMGQRLEGWLVNLFMAWCVVVLIFDGHGRARILGIVAMTIVACVNAYAYGLAYHGTSLDARGADPESALAHAVRLASLRKQGGPIGMTRWRPDV